MKKIIKVSAEYGIYLLLFILPWQSRYFIKEGEINGGYHEYGSISLYLSDILLLALLLLGISFLIVNKINPEKVLKAKLWLALTVFDLFVFVSIFFAQSHILAIYKYVNLLLALALFALLIYFPLDRLKLFISLCLAFLLQSVLSIFQFFYQFSPANKWLGMAEHNPQNLGISVVEAMGNIGFGERWLRAYGSLDHPNILGGFLALGLLLVIFYLVNTSKKVYLKHGESYREKLHRFNLYLYPLILIMSLAIFFSFSRSAWLALIAGLVLFLIQSVANRDKVAQKFFLPVILYVSVLIFMISLPFANLVEARIFSEGRLENISRTERMDSNIEAKKIINENMLFGVGIGNYTLKLKEKYPDKESYFYQPVHNTFLLVWAEVGIFGFLSFLAVFFIVIFSKKAKMKNIRAIMVVSLFILMLFDHWLWSLHFGLLYLFIFLAWIINFLDVDIERENVV